MKVAKLFFSFLLIFICLALFLWVRQHTENRRLEKIIQRLTADSRIAQVVVTNSEKNQEKGKTYTTIKFLEYDTKLKPLAPKYFTFSGNIIQFQSMVIRFDDFYIKRGHPLKGKSAYLFMKAFSLGDERAEIFEINKINEVPSGYRIEGLENTFQEKLWQRFWDYALNPDEAARANIKNAQIEAPGTKFIPGIIYTIKIEHGGGLRIDSQPIPEILRGEKIK